MIHVFPILCTLGFEEGKKGGREERNKERKKQLKKIQKSPSIYFPFSNNLKHQ